jgi:hypothetical protein
VKRVRLLGEDLVLVRVPFSRHGLLDRHSAHRGIDDVAAGVDPPAIHGLYEPETMDAVAPAGDWQRYWRDQVAARRRAASLPAEFHGARSRRMGE